MAKSWSTNFNYNRLELAYSKDCLLRVKINTDLFLSNSLSPRVSRWRQHQIAIITSFFFLSRLWKKTAEAYFKKFIPGEWGVCLKHYQEGSSAWWQKGSALEKAPNHQSGFHSNLMFLISLSFRKSIKKGLNWKCNIDMMSGLNETGGTTIWWSKEKINPCTSQFWNHTWEEGKEVF